jgi:hypothetical protein
MLKLETESRELSLLAPGVSGVKWWFGVPLEEVDDEWPHEVKNAQGFHDEAALTLTGKKGTACSPDAQVGDREQRVELAGTRSIRRQVVSRQGLME